MQRVMLGGKKFYVVDFDRRPVVADLRMRSIIRRGQLDTLLPEPNETDTEFIGRLEGRLAMSEQSIELVACLMIPGDAVLEADGRWKGWSEHFSSGGSKAIADHLNALTDPDDRAGVQALALETLLLFYQEHVRKLYGITGEAWLNERKRGPVRRFLDRARSWVH